MKRIINITIGCGSIREKEVEQLKKFIKIYIGKYPPIQQYAASIGLKMIMKENYVALMAGLKDAIGFKANDRGSGKVSTWTKKVKKTGKCEICGDTNNLQAHHIIPWEYSVTGRTDVKNGQCLCEKCHKMIHNDRDWLRYMMGGVEECQS